MVFVCGDTHGHMDINKIAYPNWPESKDLTKDDYLIILGDFGLFFNNEPTPTEQYWLKWLNSKPFTVLFVDGNHENFDIINRFPIEHKFGQYGVVGITPYENIYHIKRGSVLEIEDKTIFVMGGGLSIDKERRVDRISWWKEEIPNYREIDDGIQSLLAYNNKVNYVLTHSVHSKGFELFFKELKQSNSNGFDEYYVPKFNDPTLKIHDEFYGLINFDWWYCGHYHKDIEFKDLKLTFMYNQKPLRIV